jgi:hypothetical protein
MSFILSKTKDKTLLFFMDFLFLSCSLRYIYLERHYASENWCELPKNSSKLNGHWTIHVDISWKSAMLDYMLFDL